MLKYETDLLFSFTKTGTIKVLDNLITGFQITVIIYEAHEKLRHNLDIK